MACEKDVMAILKGLSAKVTPDTLMVLAYMNHNETTLGPDNLPRRNSAMSQSRFEGRVVKTADLQAEIAEMEKAPDAPWTWPGLSGWRIGYDGSMTNARGARWLKSRIKKAVDWDTAKKIMDGWKKTTNDFKDNRKYDQTGYITDGKPFDITLESVQALGPGKTFTKVCQTKRAKKA